MRAGMEPNSSVQFPAQFKLVQEAVSVNIFNSRIQKTLKCVWKTWSVPSLLTQFSVPVIYTFCASNKHMDHDEYIGLGEFPVLLNDKLD